MSGSEYLKSGEYSDFGLPSTTTLAQVKSASKLIDAFLSRPEGLVWLPDAAGTPAYMAALSPRLTLRSVGSISPGAGVQVAYAGALVDNNSVGETVVLDSIDDASVETCVISAVDQDGARSFTLQNVLNSHSTNCTMDFGLTIVEQRELPNDRSIARLAKFPIMNLISGVGRYGYGRRSQQTAGNMQEFNLLAVVSSFGGPPLWIPWQVTNASIDVNTGEIWVPAGVLLAYYTDVRMWYVAGYADDQIPFDVKQATANIVQAVQSTGLGPNIRSRNVRDGTVVSKFENNMIDANTREMLAPFKARTFV